jgi:fibronectin type 3 domain-containing protein
MRISQLFIIVLLIAGLTSCGTPGAPLPPSLGIPKPVSDLRAERKGATVALAWSAPSDTTDGVLIRKPGTMQLSRTVGPTSSVIADLPLEPSLKQDQAPAPSATDSLSTLLPGNTADFAVYSVIATSSSGKGAGPGNAVSVPLVPTADPPQRVSAKAVPLGISLSWDQSWPPQNQTHLTAQFAYRIMRKEEGAQAPVMVQQVNAGSSTMAFVDTGIEWQKHYDYWITPVTLWQQGGKKGEVEGSDSQVVSVFANDIFPPAAPSGLQAVFSGMPQQLYIDLTWTPNTEPDLAGYNVYRRVADEAPVKINSDLVKTPSFRDANVKAGTKYFYTVSAVDLRGNESVKSTETSEAVPAD